MAAFKVTEESVCSISPATPSGGKLLEVSILDLMQKRDVMPYLQRVAFYPSCNDPGAVSDRIQRLKKSLSLVLVEFYPFAGRLAMDSGGRPVIDCNDAGVEFCEGSTDASLCDIDYTQPNAFFNELIKRGSYETATAGVDDVPILSIQVTKFKCGGLCLAWSFEHIIGDGKSLWHFMSSWAEVCSGKEISLLPHHSRSFEKDHEQLKSLYAELSTINNSPFSYKFTDKSVGVVARTFKFSKKQIEKLKAMASTNHDQMRFSSYEVLGAHIWRAITRARDISDKTQKIGYCIAYNIRSKLNPPLPHGFSGNAILMPAAQTTVEELLNEGIAFAANLIHEAIQSFDIKDILSSIKDYKLSSANPLGLGIDEGIHVWHGGSLRFPLYEIDFGWGKAISVKNVRCLWDGFCYFDPYPGDDGKQYAEITICLKPHTMEKIAHFAHIF